MNEKENLESIQKLLETLRDIAELAQDDKKDEDKVDDQPSCDRSKALPQKLYQVHLDGDHDHIYGDGLYQQDSGDIIIYSDARLGHVRAIIRNFDRIEVYEVSDV